MPPSPTTTIYRACASLERAIAMVRAARGSIPRKLPIAASEDHIGDVDTLLAIAGGALERALAPIAAEIERLQKADEIAFAREHGVSAMAGAA